MAEELHVGGATHDEDGSKIEEPEHDPVNHPRHYTSSPATCECGRTIECIQIVEYMGFCLGEGLKKAVWYIQRKIENREKSNG
ncbi:hypothetical protein [Dermacoccus nishinomiyaensis]|uniref:hypothetical protein n=1 Tax=Dermacoccus nishinomiyaensis TaxID=1274 RepID=UPI00248F2AE9|nr:hypothetical protein [Dermacoccus nishinomiyaensis]